MAQAAEQAGFDTLWAGEHHVLATSSTGSRPRTATSTRWLLLPMSPPLPTPSAWDRSVAPAVAPPLTLAKELASLDVLSSGHLIVGIGVGWAEAEFEALGVPFTNEGRAPKNTW